MRETGSRAARRWRRKSNSRAGPCAFAWAGPGSESDCPPTASPCPRTFRLCGFSRVAKSASNHQNSIALPRRASSIQLHVYMVPPRSESRNRDRPYALSTFAEWKETSEYEYWTATVSAVKLRCPYERTLTPRRQYQYDYTFENVTRQFLSEKVAKLVSPAFGEGRWHISIGTIAKAEGEREAWHRSAAVADRSSRLSRRVPRSGAGCRTADVQAMGPPLRQMHRIGVLSCCGLPLGSR